MNPFDWFTAPRAATGRDPVRRPGRIADADWHLLVGDSTALRSIGAALARIPAGRPAIAVLELDDLAEPQRVSSPGELTVHWLCPRASFGRGRALLAAVRALEFPAGQVHAVVHGETGWVRAVRSHLLVERGIGRDWLSLPERRGAGAAMSREPTVAAGAGADERG